MGFRRAAAVQAARLSAAASRVAGRGGTALPGLVATAVDPGIVATLAAQLPAGSIVVAGTNGKTTTSRMLAVVLAAGGLDAIRNQSGSNLVRGLASSLIRHAGLSGDLHASPRAVGLFETDEAALPAVLRAVRPRLLVLLNLFRDQLDRYGEVATIGALWESALRDVPGTAIVANADDPLIADIAERSGRPVTFFGIASAGEGAAEAAHAGDVKGCPRCGGPIAYSVIFLGHLGHYRCLRCPFARPDPSVSAHDAKPDGIKGSTFTLQMGDAAIPIHLPLPGLYNVYNAVAAAAAARDLDVAPDAVRSGLETVTPAFGRMEHLEIEGRHVYLALAKNPTGLNEVMRTIGTTAGPLNLLPMLNDNAADGRDVSWIWDAEVEILAGRVARATFSGTRAADMALRFKYAEAITTDDAASWSLESDPEAAFREALAGTPPHQYLFLIPTYTALLEIRGVLTRLGYARPYWEE